VEAPTTTEQAPTATTEAAPAAEPETAAVATSEPAPAETATGGEAAPEGSTVEDLPRGGVLRFSSALDPGRIGTNSWSDAGFAVGYAVFDRLWETDGQGLVPGLAAALPESADGATWRIGLRGGVTFHDGTPLTAEDVRYSIERQTLPANGSDAQASFAALGIAGTQAFVEGAAPQLDGIVVVDELTLEIQLDAPNGALPYWLAMPMAGIVSAAYARQVGDEEFERSPVGTGPYRVTSYEPGQAIVLDRYLDHWRTGVGHVDSVEWTIGVDPEQALARIQAGEQDLMLEAVPDTRVAELQKAPGYTEATFSECYFVTNSVVHAATKDRRVREAVAHAIDRDAIVAQLAGLGEVASGGLFAPSSSYWQGREDGFPQRFFDQEKAKALLAEAGFGGGFDVVVLALDQPPIGTVAQGVAASLDAIGIRTTLRLLPADTWLQGALDDPTAMVVGRQALPCPHGSYVMDAFAAPVSEACCNFARATSPEVEALAAEARSTPEAARQVRLYRRLDRVLAGDELLWVPLFYPRYAALVGDGVRGFYVPGSPSGGAKHFGRYAVGL
jgi:peptide/nickel transport system substrate-binding protein/oligopeptide transport system substrate-binding protein